VATQKPIIPVRYDGIVSFSLAISGSDVDYTAVANGTGGRSAQGVLVLTAGTLNFDDAVTAGQSLSLPTGYFTSYIGKIYGNSTAIGQVLF
jgi:hypothetical protein